MKRCKLGLILLLGILCFAGFDTTKDKKEEAQTDLDYRNQLGTAIIDEKGIPYADNEWSALFNKLLYLLREYKQSEMTPMEALDLVKEVYADNFDKIYIEGETVDYYYKLADMEYYLAYEGPVEGESCYLIHLYEFVLDEPEYGEGHFVTYGWFTVDKWTGEIKVME